MRLDLTPHPDSPPSPAAGIRVTVARTQTNELYLRYVVSGDIDALLIPRQVDPARTDDLWKRTCFEIFITTPAGAPYFEFNFSPSTQWAAYAFTGYREGMSPLDTPPPFIARQVGSTELELTASLNLASATAFAGVPWRAAISAVVEDGRGEKSYWALAHPSGKPDFHHADSFALDLPAPETT